jgi:hypothetical protein
LEAERGSLPAFLFYDQPHRKPGDTFEHFVEFAVNGFDRRRFGAVM